MTELRSSLSPLYFLQKQLVIDVFPHLFRGYVQKLGLSSKQNEKGTTRPSAREGEPHHDSGGSGSGRCIVTDLLKRIRKGQNASLPGLGTFGAGPKQDFEFDGTASKKESQ